MCVVCVATRFQSSSSCAVHHRSCTHSRLVLSYAPQCTVVFRTTSLSPETCEFRPIFMPNGSNDASWRKDLRLDEKSSNPAKSRKPNNLWTVNRVKESVGDAISDLKRSLAAEIDNPSLATIGKARITSIRFRKDGKCLRSARRWPWSLCWLVTSFSVSKALAIFTNEKTTHVIYEVTWKNRNM